MEGNITQITGDITNIKNNSGFILSTSASGGEVSGSTQEKIGAGKTMTVDAGQNIRITQDGSKVSIATASDLRNITSISNGDTKISLGKDGNGDSTINMNSARITNVAPGKAPTDAVNVSQLKNEVANLRDDIADVGASSAALSGLQTIQYDPLEPTQVMAAVGTYRGSSAAAIGIAHYTNESTMLHAGVSLGDHVMANVGVTWKFGNSPEKDAVPNRYKDGPISSVYVFQDEVTALKQENAEMKKQIEGLLKLVGDMKKQQESKGV